MKLKVRTQDCHLIVRVRMALQEKVDEKELDRFLRTYMRGFMKPQIVKRKQIEYTGPVGISLYERLKKPISKRDFFFVLEHTVVAIQKLEMNQFSIENVILNLQNVFINEVTKEVQFIYLPMDGKLQNGTLMEFVEAIVYSAIPMPEQDSEYISKFIYFFKGIKGFDSEKIERYIAREDRSVVNTIKKYNMGQSGFMTDKQQHYYEHYAKEVDWDDEPTGLLQEEETGILEEDVETQMLWEEETGLLSDGEETALLNENDLGDQKIKFPTLFRILTEETIKINKPVFRLGKEKNYVDYFVTNNNAVSRSHADIVTRGEQYFVIDLNSKNRTFINDEPLPAQCETEIKDGDRLKLGNEEFIFMNS